jgi:hypothetical protein
MAEPTFPQTFGVGSQRLANGAAAPSDGLFIPDSALITAGLDDPTTATAEGHLVAIVLISSGHLTQSNFDANSDQSVTITKGFSSLITRGNADYRQDTFYLNLARPDNGSTIDPDDY